MRSRFKVLGHPLHPILVVFPLALYPLALIGDIVFLAVFFIGGKVDPFWWSLAGWALLLGLVFQAQASLPGLIDWLNIPMSAPSKRTGTYHLITAIFLSILALASLLLRVFHNWGEAPSTLVFGAASGWAYVAIVLNVFLNLVAPFQGWLGGHLVYVHGIGVESSDKIDPVATVVDTEGDGEASPVTARRETSRA